MERRLIEKYDRILDETLKSLGNCLFVKDVMKLFPEIDKIEAENIIRDISENAESKKYFLFLKVDGGLNIASNSSTEILKRKGGFKFLFQNEKLTNIEIIEEIAELLREQGAHSLSMILNKLHLDLPKVRINNLRAEIKRTNYLGYNNSSSSKDDINDLWLTINDKSENYKYSNYLNMIEPNIQPMILQADSNTKKSVNKQMKKIFISHSSLDKDIVEQVIDTLEAVGVQPNQIFCSSFDGYGVKLGSDFLDTIKNELTAEVLVLFVLSSNFHSSPVSLCEMGATWVKTNEHIPILIPPFDYNEIKGVIPTTHGMKINEKGKFNLLKTKVENFMELSPVQFEIWERRRDNILQKINTPVVRSLPSEDYERQIKRVFATR